MKTPPNNLKEAFETLLLPTQAAELKYAKLFEQFSTLSETSELAALLSVDRNEFGQHIDRLKMLFKQLGLRAVRECSELDENFLVLGKEICGYKKQRSGLKDVQILGLAKQITFHRLAVYGTLDAMASALGADEVGLFKQTVEEIRSTGGYFSQIEQNILYPVLKS
ncbi:MAG: DUF892 family protein [Bacteroidota bacterium]